MGQRSVPNYPSSTQAITIQLAEISQASKKFADSLAQLGTALHTYGHVRWEDCDNVSGSWVSFDDDWVCGTCGREFSGEPVDEDQAYADIMNTISGMPHA